MRILVTGSRNWTDGELIKNALLEIETKEALKPAWLDYGTTLVTGACPTGADAIAESYAVLLGWLIERHPANWKKYGNKAGYIRNAEMVNLDWDVCLCFIKNKSKGATMTYNMAIKKHIKSPVPLKIGVWTED